MNNGFITLHRAILNWEWYDDINTTRLFIHLLLKANHKDQKWHGNLIKRGQLITGRIELSKQTGLSQQQIRTCLSKLKSTSEITSKPTNRNTLITLVNYNNYQDNKEQATSQTSRKQPTDNQQITTNNNVNNVNNKKTCQIPYQLIVDMYHDKANELQRVIIITNKRKSAIKKLFNYHPEHKKIEWWSDYFSKINSIRFLQGDNDRNWKADFDFVTKFDNFIKIIEGKYK